MNFNFIDVTGQTFGLVRAVLLIDRRDSAGNRMWQCVCKCGEVFETSGRSLRTGHTKSCGCLRKTVSPRNLVNTPSHRKHHSGR